MLEKGGLNCEQEEFVAQGLRKAIADCEQAEKQEPIAWKHCDDERVIANATKQGAIADGGAIAATTKDYSIPAYTHQSRVRRLSEAEIEEIISKYATLNHDNSPINCSIHTWARLHDYTNSIMDACGVPKGREL